MKRMFTALAALSLVASGCSTLVLDPVSTGSGASSGGGGGGTGGGSSGPGPNALALRGSDIHDGDIAWIQGPLPWAGKPDWLVLMFGSAALSCEQPVYPIDCVGAHRWETILAIPPEIDSVGSIDLQDGRIFVYEMIVEPSPGGCGRALGGGNGFWGTLDVEQSDDASITLTLSDSGGESHPPANGHYVAPRCGAPPAAPPVPASAFRGASVPAGGPQGLDPDALYVVVDTGGAVSCASPFSDVCNATSRLAFTLPPALQQPGKIDLSDPAIAATFTITADQGNDNCQTDTGTFTLGGSSPAGSIEIQSVDGAAVALRVFGSFTHTEHNFIFEADGHYSASICP